MAWIESHQTLGHHPKTLALAAALKCSLPCAVGYLHYFWWWALDYAKDGSIAPEQWLSIASSCGVGHLNDQSSMAQGVVNTRSRRAVEGFKAALSEARFIDIDSAGVARIHNWTDYVGKFQSQKDVRKAANREAQRKRREKLAETRSSMTNDDADDSQHPTVPNLTVPNLTIPVVAAAAAAAPGGATPARARTRARTKTPALSPDLLAEHERYLARERAAAAAAANSISSNGGRRRG